MTADTYDDKTFEKEVYSDQKINGKEFQSCNFIKCDFSNCDLSHNRFFDCEFDGCNLSLIKLRGSALNNVIFRHCKITGVNFNECGDFLFSARFENCVADYSTFTSKKMTKTNFIKTSLKEVNFEQADLSGAVFDEANLEGAVFIKTNLAAANFSTAFNYNIDPELNNIKKARFALDGLPGLLTKHNINIV